uniref:hypothetical protein n=1 Tax=Neorhizobium sp. EC2-8 TaxID=3129230 RepID=UPI003100C6C1
MAGRLLCQLQEKLYALLSNQPAPAKDQAAAEGKNHRLPRQAAPWETLVENGVRWGSKRRFGIGPVPWIKRYFDQADAMLASIHRSSNRGSQPQFVKSQDGFGQGRIATNGPGQPGSANVAQRGALPAPQNLSGKVSS